jgi:GNAT superfamily N-acetyltransferase
LLSPVRIIDSSEMRMVTEFMKLFELASKFVTVDIDHATKTYEGMIDHGIAVVMVIEDDGELAGSLGFIVSQDLHSGEKVMIETFWFTHPEKRGCGLRLLDAYEKYAEDNNMDKIAMIHMMDSYPERLEKLYIRRGYKLIEKHYVKELIK